MRDFVESAVKDLGHRWGWYCALGTVLILCGAAASTFAFATTIASVVVFGWILLFAGAALGLLSFLTGRWSGFLLSLLGSILSISTGVLLLRAPLAGAATLTLVIASYLLASGVFRAAASVVMRFPNWGWSLLSGIVSVGLGGWLLAAWPVVSLWFLGFYVGIDLMAHGFSWCMFAVSVRELSRNLASSEQAPERKATAAAGRGA